MCAVVKAHKNADLQEAVNVVHCTTLLCCYIELLKSFCNTMWEGGSIHIEHKGSEHNVTL